MERSFSTLTEQQLQKAALADCMRHLSCLWETRGAPITAAKLFLERYPRAVHAAVVRKHFDALTTKAAIAPGNTTDAAWANPLAVPGDLVEPLWLLVQQQSLLGKISGLREVPFNTPTAIQTTGADFGWVGEASPKSISKFAFDDVRLSPTKLAGTVVLTNELVRLSAPSSVTAMSNQLVADSVRFQDRQLVDPTLTEIATIRPASLTADVTPTPSTGDLQADVASLLAALYASRPGVALPTLVMSPTQAGLLPASGLHPDLTTSGGSAFGVGVVTSPWVAQYVVALDAAAIAFASGGLELDISREASLQMDSAPGAPTASTVLVSLWQLNLVGIRVEHMVNWSKVPGSVQFLTGASGDRRGATLGGKGGGAMKLSPAELATIVVDTIARALAPIVARLGLVDTRLTAHDARVDALETEVATLRKMLDATPASDDGRDHATTH